VKTAQGRKHSLLLAAVLVLQVGEPLLAHRSVTTEVLFDVAFVAACLYLVHIVFEEARHRRIGLLLFLPITAGQLGVYVLPSRLHTPSVVLAHVSVIVLLGFAVAIILRDLFRKAVISGDDVLGAIVGYILVAMVWANLYGLAYMFEPGAFNVSSDITAQLADWRLKRSLFAYLSLTTLTSMGYGDITPVGQPAYSLSWIEVMLGQFYMAVVVAQLVGLKLAQAISHAGAERR
jgi:hypothetical protein